MSEGGRVEVSLQKANCAPQSPRAGGGGEGVCAVMTGLGRGREIASSDMFYTLYLGDYLIQKRGFKVLKLKRG